MAFDYTATDTPDEVIRAVVAEMRDADLKPISEDERLKRQLWRDEQAWLAEQRRIERERQRERQRDEAEAIARHEAALEQAEQNRALRLAQQERDKERQREREFLDLRIQAAQTRGWMINAETAARNAVRQRYTQTLMGRLDAMINPPQPAEPAREIIYISEDEGSADLGDRDFNPALWMRKSRRWW
jgi:hypothetical protein